MPERDTPPVFAFVGDSGSGKTTFLVELVRELRKRGARVAVMKNTHKEVETDIEGKDSRKMKDAGAEVVVLNSPTRLVVNRVASQRASALELAGQLAGRVDIVLVEGLGEDSGRLPVIEVAKDGPSERFAREKRIAIISARNLDGFQCFNFDEAARVAEFLLERAGHFP